jgi:hypothetical protein
MASYEQSVDFRLDLVVGTWNLGLNCHLEKLVGSIGKQLAKSLALTHSRNHRRINRPWLEGVEEGAELADVLDAVPAFSRHCVLGHLFVVPGERVWDVHGASSERDYGRDIGA